MKQLLTLLILAISLSVSAQKKAPEYSDYSPCTECFEQWKVSEGTTSSPEVNASLPKSTGEVRGRTRKPFRETYVGQTLNSSARVIVGTALMIFTAIILTKATHPTIQ